MGLAHALLNTVSLATAFSRPPTAWTDACADDDLVEGQPYTVTVEDTPVLLMRSAGRVTAIGNRCTHRGAPLSDGDVVDGCIECPWDASRFDLVTGQVRRGPATRPLPAPQTHTVAGRVQVRREGPRQLHSPAS